MYFPKLELTNLGRSMIADSLNGGSIIFTKFQLGKGSPSMPTPALNALGNSIITIPINGYELGEASILLTGSFDNGSLTEGFYATELGVFAKDENDVEHLYAYGYESDNPTYIPAYSSMSFAQTTLNLTVAVGDAEKVSAIISNLHGYATEEALKEHIDDSENPHNVTKAQVGLSNVPNDHPKDVQIPFSVPERASQPVSGETVTGFFAKTAAVIRDFFGHIKATNPHKITAAAINAALSDHSHYVTGTYSGNGTHQRIIDCGFIPSAVYVSDRSGRTNTGSGIFGGLALRGYSVKTDPATLSTGMVEIVYGNSVTAVAITGGSNGFTVNENEETNIHTNKMNVDYAYIAFK
ncbi:MAG: hypothetical protein ACI4OB_07065 [Christensenellales bacterium]